ncbi:MAG TPA: type 1 glutamine amidotransferase domain-containing protein [Thermoanaerobaculia bacterium]
MANELRGKRVAILVTDGFEQIEMTSPREALEKAGATCVLIAPKEEVQGFKHHDKADKFRCDLPLSKADAGDFDAVMLPGGVINADAIRIEKKAQQFVQEMDRAGKPIAVICHGPWLLVSAGLVRGRTMTSWPTLQDDLRNAGATWQDKECIRDGRWVSSRKPDDLPAFNREMVTLFAETQPSAAMRAENRDSLGVRQ